MLPVTKLTKEDFDDIIERLEVFWGVRNDKILAFHQPMCLHEFGDTAFVAKDDGKVVAYIFGLISQTDPETAYGQALACDPSYRGQGVVERLCSRFMEEVRARGCRRMKVLVFPKNFRSILFHMKLGFEPEGTERDSNGIRIVKDYWGRGLDYVVMYRPTEP